MAFAHRQALDLVRAGDWEAAHALVQSRSDRLSCLIHAYLHRVKGDLGNARYWYRQAGEPMPDHALAAELNRLQQLSDADPADG